MTLNEYCVDIENVTIDKIKLLDSNKDPWEDLLDILKTLHYTNSETMEDYFEYYDEEDEFWSFFNDFEVDHVENDIVKLVMTHDKLVEYCTWWFDGTDKDSGWKKLDMIPIEKLSFLEAR